MNASNEEKVIGEDDAKDLAARNREEAQHVLSTQSSASLTLWGARFKRGRGQREDSN